ncbi:MAG: glycosyltransferase family 9 protein, partial [Nitrospinota bacterium]
MRASVPLPSEAGSVLVLGPTWVGDTVLATPFLASLRSALPEARVSFLANGWTRALVGTFPWVDRVLVLGEGGGGGRRGRWRGLRRVVAELREEAPDIAFLLPNSFRSALVAFLAGAKRRVGYATGWR